LEVPGCNSFEAGTIAFGFGCRGLLGLRFQRKRHREQHCQDNNTTSRKLASAQPPSALQFHPPDGFPSGLAEPHPRIADPERLSFYPNRRAESIVSPPEVGTVAARFFDRFLAAPAPNLFVIAADKDFRNLPAAKRLGPRVVRVVEHCLV